LSRSFVVEVMGILNFFRPLGLCWNMYFLCLLFFRRRIKVKY
jgi:hypothetical protein